MQPVQEPMECPRCDRKGLVQRNAEVYQCVYCGFRRDLTGSAETVDSLFLWIVSLIIIIFVMVGLGRDQERRERMRSVQMSHQASQRTTKNYSDRAISLIESRLPNETSTKN